MRTVSKTSYDAVVVGAGPNGLAAAIRLAQEKLSVLVIEANDTIGGGARTAELTLPGFRHDVCSSVHPLTVGSPFFRRLPLEQFGLSWIEPEIPVAHPLDGNRAMALYRSVGRTAKELGVDGRAYERLMVPLVSHWKELAAEFLKPMLHMPRHPIQFARFGLRGLRSAMGLARNWFSDEPARALLGDWPGIHFCRSNRFRRRPLAWFLEWQATPSVGRSLEGARNKLQMRSRPSLNLLRAKLSPAGVLKAFRNCQKRE